MAWTAPMTAVANSAFTAAEFNTYVRDNLNTTPAALATAASQIFVATGLNSIAARTIGNDFISTNETTASTSFTDLATPGPAVTVTTGPSALVFVTVRMQNTDSYSSYAGHAVSGASTIAASADDALILDPGTGNQGRSTALTFHAATLTAGANVFTCKYKVDAGTGSFAYRRIVVVPL